MMKLHFLVAYAAATLVSRQREEKGATAVEYALVIGLVSIVVVGAVALLKTPLDTFVSGIKFG